jgi:hypothetical protein
LCEAALECQLKALFIARSAFMRDNRHVKKTSCDTDACLAACDDALPGNKTQMLGGLIPSSWPLRVRWAACAVLSLSAMAWSCGAAASDKGDHERARQALQSGQVMPLAKVLARIEGEHPGQVLEVELESHDRQWHYEIKILQPDGRLSKLKVDARTGVLVQQKTR